MSRASEIYSDLEDITIRLVKEGNTTNEAYIDAIAALDKPEKYKIATALIWGCIQTDKELRDAFSEAIMQEIICDNYGRE